MKPYKWGLMDGQAIAKSMVAETLWGKKSFFLIFVSMYSCDITETQDMYIYHQLLIITNNKNCAQVLL